MKLNSTLSRLVFSTLLSAGLCISPMRAQAQIDSGNAPEDQSAAAQKAKAQEQRSKLGSKGGEKRIINNGKIEKGLGGPDTKTKGAEAFKKAGRGDKTLGGPDTKGGEKGFVIEKNLELELNGPGKPGKGALGSTKPGDNKGDSSYGTGVYKKGGQKAQEPYLKKSGPTSPPEKALKQRPQKLHDGAIIATPLMARAAIQKTINDQLENKKQQQQNTAGKGGGPRKSDKALGGPDTKATVKGFNPQPDPPGGPVKPGPSDANADALRGADQQKKKVKGAAAFSTGKVIGGPPVGTAVGRAIGNPANDPDEDKAEKKKSLSPDDKKKAEAGLPGEGSNEGTITPGSNATGKAAAASAKSRLKKKGLTPEDKKKAADALGNALGDLDEDGGGETITPGTPDREPPNLLKKKDATAVSDGSGGTISPGTSPTPRPKLLEKP